MSVAEPLTGTSPIDEMPTILALTAALSPPECSVARPLPITTRRCSDGRPRSDRSVFR